MNVSARIPTDVVFEPKRLNRISTVVTLVALTVLFGLYGLFYRHGFQAFFGMPFWGVLLFLGAFFAIIFVHECIHGLCYKLLGKSAFKILFDKKNLMPMCAAKSPMRVCSYRVAVCMPSLLLGALPLLYGLAAGNTLVYLMGCLQLVAGIGDAAILWGIRKFPGNALVQDHPSKPGCIVYM